MNVKNLKQMFERKSVVPQGQPPKQQILNRPKAPTQPLVKAPSINFSYSKDPPPPIPQPIKTNPNNNFLEQLNKKLARQSATILKPQIQSLPEEVPDQMTQPITKHQSELNIDDIITGMEKIESKQEQMNVRYGINQKYPNRSRQKTMFEKSITESGHTGNSSFTDMLQNMLSSLNRKKEAAVQNEESPKNVKKQTSKITNKLQYDQSYKTKNAKTTRIDFVLKVIFREKDFQNIGHLTTNSQQNNHSIIFEQKEEDSKQVKNQPKNQDNQLVLEQIVKKKHEEHQENTISSTAKRPSMVSNNFLNELTLKLAKKSMGQMSNTSPQASPVNIRVQSILPAIIDKQIKLQEEKVIPRQKKKGRTRQNFDDF